MTPRFPPLAWYTVREVCAILNVSRRTVYDWIHKGLLESAQPNPHRGGHRIAGKSLNAVLCGNPNKRGKDRKQRARRQDNMRDAYKA